MTPEVHRRSLFCRVTFDAFLPGGMVSPPPGSFPASQDDRR